MRLKEKGEEGFETQYAVATACKSAQGKKTSVQIAKETGVSHQYVEELWRHILKKVKDAKPGNWFYKFQGRIKKLKPWSASRMELEKEFNDSRLCSDLNKLIAIGANWDDGKIMDKWNKLLDSHKNAPDEMKQMAKDKLDDFFQTRKGQK